MYKRVRLETNVGNMYVSQPISGTYYFEIGNQTVHVPVKQLRKALTLANQNEPYPSTNKSTQPKKKGKK